MHEPQEQQRHVRAPHEEFRVGRLLLLGEDLDGLEDVVERIRDDPAQLGRRGWPLHGERLAAPSLAVSEDGT